jgi:hypothetical protein
MCHEGITLRIRFETEGKLHWPIVCECHDNLRRGLKGLLHETMIAKVEN